MNRRKFVSSTFKTSAVACSALCFGGMERCLAGSLVENSKETSCEDKVNFNQSWIKRFMEVMDSKLDEKTRTDIMEENGKRCYLGSLQHRKISPDDIEKVLPKDFVEGINKYLGEEAAVIKDNVIEFRYIKNPEGLKVADGFCLCPMVENGPEGLSGTYCDCSVGYVKEMFTVYLKQPVEVELIESLKRGGKTCKFKIKLDKTN